MHITSELAEDDIVKIVPYVRQKLIDALSEAQAMIESFEFHLDGWYIEASLYGYTIASSTCLRCGKDSTNTCSVRRFIGIPGKRSGKNSKYICRPCFEELRVLPDIEFYKSI